MAACPAQLAAQSAVPVERHSTAGTPSHDRWASMLAWASSSSSTTTGDALISLPWLAANKGGCPDAQVLQRFGSAPYLSSTGTIRSLTIRPRMSSACAHRMSGVCPCHSSLGSAFARSSSSTLSGPQSSLCSLPASTSHPSIE
eukprot:5568607-Prymnesium_polylepis.1